MRLGTVIDEFNSAGISAFHEQGIYGFHKALTLLSDVRWSNLAVTLNANMSRKRLHA